jgi:hypothetical protein
MPMPDTIDWEPFDYDLENRLAAEVLDAYMVKPVGRETKTMKEMRTSLVCSALWEYAYQRGIHAKLVTAWLKKQKPGTVDHLGRDELESEANMAMRKAIHRFQPGRGSLFRYMRMPVYEALDIYRGQSRSPVQLGQKMARQLRKDLHAEEYHQGGDEPDALEEIAQ